MSGNARQSLRNKTLIKVSRSSELSSMDKLCIYTVFKAVDKQKEEIERLNAKIAGLYKEIERIALMTVETDRKDLCDSK
jgi:hypothetical protein